MSDFVAEQGVMMTDKLVQWLAALPNISEIKPITVTMRPGPKTVFTFEGAYYRQTHKYGIGEVLNLGGRVREGEDRIEHGLYLLGERPKFRRAHHCFPWASNLPIDERVLQHTDEWYIAGYMPGERITDEFRPHHPFGPNILMREWMSPTVGYYKDHKIDTLERFAYLRVPMSVEFHG
jgi:hypothetical protein